MQYKFTIKHCLEMIDHYASIRDYGMQQEWELRLADALLWEKKSTIIPQPTGIVQLVMRAKGHVWIGEEHYATSFKSDEGDE